MQNGNQTTLDSVRIEPYYGKIPCCKVIDHSEGKPVKCGRKPVVRLQKGIRAKHFCRIHARDTWLEMAGLGDD